MQLLLWARGARVGSGIREAVSCVVVVCVDFCCLGVSLGAGPWQPPCVKPAFKPVKLDERSGADSAGTDRNVCFTAHVIAGEVRRESQGVFRDRRLRCALAGIVLGSFFVNFQCA